MSIKGFSFSLKDITLSQETVDRLKVITDNMIAEYVTTFPAGYIIDKIRRIEDVSIVPDGIPDIFILVNDGNGNSIVRRFDSVDGSLILSNTIF